MKRIMFDTSVYGKLVTEIEVLNKIREKHKFHEFALYGSPVIRKELRATPKILLYDARKLRLLLLNLYDSFIAKDGQVLKLNKLVEALSKDYFLEYRKKKGNLSNKAIMNDLMIVATATIYQLDIIVSDDESTMLSNNTLKSYKSVNANYGLRDPKFQKYAQFKRELTR